MQVLCLASSRGRVCWQWAEPLSPAAEAFGVLRSPLGQRPVGLCTPKSQPAENFTACPWPPARDGTRLGQHRCIKGSLEESWLETVLLKRKAFRFCY